MIQGWHGQTVKSISGRQANHIGICPQTTQNFAEKIAGQEMNRIYRMMIGNPFPKEF